MRCLTSFVLILFVSVLHAQEKAAGTLQTDLPGKTQPEYFLDRAEKRGWMEKENERTAHSSTFIAPDGKRIAYSSVADVNYKNATGQWMPVDIRPQYVNGKWEATHQPYPLIAASESSILFYPNGTIPIKLVTQQINGITPATIAGRKDGLHVWFDQITPGVSKQIEFRNGCFKFNYVLDKSPVITGTDFIITEKLTLPADWTIAPVEDTEGETLAYGIVNGENVLVSGIHKLICYDANGEKLIGTYSLKELGIANEYLLEFRISAAWINASTRTFPLIIDPLVTGPTTTWGGGIFPSCFFPAYYDDDSIQITVPAGITVTDLLVTSSFYANPFTSTIMLDGRMYFSTNCNQSGVYQVQLPNGTTGGTAYLEDEDMNAPLMCCLPQSCSSFTFWVKMHLSRTTNGTTCNSNFLYYNTPTTWPFSAYVEGYTNETYSNEMTITPNTICADVCQVTANVFARYGVPPFTFTHPWSATNVVWGNPAGCSNASYVKQLTLDIPNCPDYCNPATQLNIPPPVVTDACGTSAAGFNASYTITIKPVPQLTTADTTIVCSNQPYVIQWNDCLGGSTVFWGGNGSSGTTLIAVDTITNTSNGITSTNYIITGALNGCAIQPDTAYVITYPYITPDFTYSPEPPILNNSISFTDNTQYNGNTATGWQWVFGDTLGSFLQNPTHIFTAEGTYTICFLASTEFGCSDTVCKEILVVPPDLVMPNVISPNGDGSNDVLYFKYLEQYPTNKLSVFNRWGDLIYEKDNYTNDWEANGVSDGAYYYVLNLPGDKNYGQFLHIMRSK